MNSMDGQVEGHAHRTPDVKKAEARRRLDERGTEQLSEFVEQLARFEVMIGELYLQAHAAERWAQDKAVKLEQKIATADDASRVGLLREMMTMHQEIDSMWARVEAGMQKLREMEAGVQKLRDSLSTLRRKYMN